ncbi:hypothetical protein AB9K32_03480 [Allomuricauda sp. XS_ASV26]|jgi:hypothetical protein|uniref:Uncharacterized protein n=1 Tax=Flagellimonas marinaquae TaxID=254955 RepID=A0AA48HBC1_9FLAO|nr:hypothetical protein [Allomuricauda aquimarina]USD24742.1 hypothetical protein MJO53_13765 [Allomuricauda aquimarina]BDW93744.1 hypothetical protein MACH07_25760 [Allomuricauda aquimarina]
MKTWEKGILIIVSGYCAMHLAIVMQIVPHHIVWGGKIDSIEKLFVLEGFALATMLFLGIVLAMKNKIIKPIFTDKVIKRILLVFSVFFILNTLGNLMAETNIEKVQAVITLYLAFALFKSSKQIETL